jgi:Zn-dependent peptidase ImmA (M78 family)
MMRVEVKPEVLRWAMDRSRLPLEELQRKFPKIRQWAAGESQPTLRQLESMAKATYTPLGFLFLEEPPSDELPVPYFRTLGDEALRGPSPHLLETIQTMQQRQAWMREYLIDQGQERLPFVASARLDEHPAQIAQRMRRTLGFGENWAAQLPSWTDALRVLREAMEGAGILVAVNGIVGNNTHRNLDPAEFRGFVLVDEYAPLVFVNGADFKAPQMFTLAHELAHVFFGSSAAFDLRQTLPASDPMEQMCNRVAAEFLVAEGELRQAWPAVGNDPEPFQVIARRFKVSAVVAARRALDLGLIPRNAFFEFYGAYQSREQQAAARRAEGGDFYANQNFRVGLRFASAVIRAAKEGKLLYSEAFRLTGLYGKTFDRYAASVASGGRGAE